jgi:hypothetical protein
MARAKRICSCVLNAFRATTTAVLPIGFAY